MELTITRDAITVYDDAGQSIAVFETARVGAELLYGLKGAMQYQEPDLARELFEVYQALVQSTR